MKVKGVIDNTECYLAAYIYSCRLTVLHRQRMRNTIYITRHVCSVPLYNTCLHVKHQTVHLDLASSAPQFLQKQYYKCYSSPQCMPRLHLVNRRLLLYLFIILEHKNCIFSFPFIDSSSPTEKNTTSTNTRPGVSQGHTVLPGGSCCIYLFSQSVYFAHTFLVCLSCAPSLLMNKQCDPILSPLCSYKDDGLNPIQRRSSSLYPSPPCCKLQMFQYFFFFPFYSLRVDLTLF